jgi:death on curing protein
MKEDPRWIAKKALLLLHEESIAEFGGARGLRDDGLLDSALARPRNVQADHPTSSLADLAAAYAYGLAKTHAFVDGNKRIAFLALGLFLALNRHRLQANQVDAIQTMQAVASGALDERGLSAWIANNMAADSMQRQHQDVSRRGRMGLEGDARCARRQAAKKKFR